MTERIYDYGKATLTIGGVEYPLSNAKVTSTSERVDFGNAVTVNHESELRPSPSLTQLLRDFGTMRANLSKDRSTFKRAAHHEAGHAAAALMVGFRILNVGISGPDTGATLLAIPDSYRPRDKHFLGAAGVASDVLFGHVSMIKAIELLMAPGFWDSSLLDGMPEADVIELVHQSIQRLDSVKDRVARVAKALLERDLTGAEVDRLWRQDTGITDTSKQDHSRTLMGSLTGCRTASAAIEAMEAEGQRELLASAQLPVDMLGGSPEQLEIIGIKLGSLPGPGDDQLFRSATLPAGWRLEPTGHAMWSELLDDKGRKRASIFYKAAFYDRKAHIELSRRFRVEVDYADRERHKRAACSVLDVAVRVHRVERAIANTEQPWLDVDAVKDECEAWLNERWPDWRDPTRYWD